MTFALLRGYDHISVVARLDPVAAVRGREPGGRISRHPKISPAGSPDFGHAVQCGDEGEIGDRRYRIVRVERFVHFGGSGRPGRPGAESPSRRGH
ncbi:hypothetical protein [Actinomadura sp. GTD37]|uniref:hypothetical protein n=1 Tax=Actinomadura sp. GTD37 TaxID=1778030 RepID=UPI0035C18036